MSQSESSRTEQTERVFTYIRVKWLHDSPTDPVVLLSELDDARFEHRKVEIYRDGRRDFADEQHESGDTRLGELPLPTIEELSADAEFVAEAMDKEEFEKEWRLAARGPSA